MGREEAAEVKSVSSETAEDRSFYAPALGLWALTMVTNSLAYIFSILMGRMLGPVGFGSLSALLAFIALLESPWAAVHTVAAHHVAIAGDARRRVIYFLRRMLLASAVAGVIMAILLPLGGALLFDERPDRVRLLAIAGLTVAFSIASTAMMGDLHGSRRFLRMGGISAAAALTRLGLGAALVLAGWGVAGALLGTAGRAIVLFLGALISTGIPRKREEGPEDPRPVLREWFPVFAALGALAILTGADMLVVKARFDPVDAGHYAASALFGKVVLFLAAAAGLVLFPHASASGAGDKSRGYLLRALAFALVPAGAVLGLYLVAARPLSALVFGESFEGAASLLPLAGLAMAFAGIVQILLQYFVATRHVRHVFTLCAIVLLEPLALLLLPGTLTQVWIVVAVSTGFAALVGLLLAFRPATGQAT